MTVRPFVPRDKRINIGRRIKRWRKHFGYSQTQAAQILDFSVRTIQDYEQGRRGHGLGILTYHGILERTEVLRAPRRKQAKKAGK